MSMVIQIEKKAQSSNIDIKQYVDQNSQKFRDFLAKSGYRHD